MWKKEGTSERKERERGEIRGKYYFSELRKN